MNTIYKVGDVLVELEGPEVNNNSHGGINVKMKWRVMGGSLAMRQIVRADLELSYSGETAAKDLPAKLVTSRIMALTPAQLEMLRTLAPTCDQPLLVLLDTIEHLQPA